MAVLVNPSNVKVISQNGEVTLSLQIDLNINLNCNGSPSVNGGFNSPAPPVSKPKDEEDNATWLVPDFNSKEKIKFGK